MKHKQQNIQKFASENRIYEVFHLLKSICAKYSHLQLPNGYYRETLKKLMRMERVSNDLWRAELDDVEPITISLTDNTDEILCFAHEKLFLYLGHKNSKITVWNIETGKLLKEHVQHDRSVTQIAYNGRYVVSGSKDKTLILWSTFEDGKNIIFDVYNHFNQPVTQISFEAQYLYSLCQNLNIIYCWIVMTRSFGELSEIIDIRPNILEIKAHSDFLFTRAKSKYIKIYENKYFEEKRVIDNEEEVVAMHPHFEYIITCDVKYDIRIFHIIRENQLRFIQGFYGGIVSITAVDGNIILAGTDGRIQKICNENYDFTRGGIKLIDTNYFKIEEGIRKITINVKSLMCLISKTKFKIIDVSKRNYFNSSYWKPKYVLSMN